jgi:hypothetical protein
MMLRNLRDSAPISLKCVLKSVELSSVRMT